MKPSNRTQEKRQPVLSLRTPTNSAEEPNSKAAVDELARLFSSSSVPLRDEAALALSDSQSAGIAVLMNGLSEPDPIFRARVVSCIAATGENGLPALAKLIEGCRDESERIQRSCLEAIGELGPAAKHAAIVIADITADTHKSDSVRIAAADALGKLENKAPPVLRALEDALACTNNDIQMAAAAALVRLGEPTEPVIEVLQHLLSNRETVSRSLMLLRQAGRSATPVIPQIKDLLSHPNLRAEAASAIYNISGQSEDLVPLLVEDLQRNRWPGDDLPPTLGFDERNTLRQQNLVRSKMAAAGVLREIGPAAKAAVPILSELALGPNHEVRSVVLEALCAISGDF